MPGKVIEAPKVCLISVNYHEKYDNYSVSAYDDYAAQSWNEFDRTGFVSCKDAEKYIADTKANNPDIRFVREYDIEAYKTAA